MSRVVRSRCLGRARHVARRVCWAAVTGLPLLLATGCKDSWATTQKQLASRMSQVDAAVAASASLRAESCS